VEFPYNYNDDLKQFARLTKEEADQYEVITTPLIGEVLNKVCTPEWKQHFILRSSGVRTKVDHERKCIVFREISVYLRFTTAHLGQFLEEYSSPTKVSEDQWRLTVSSLYNTRDGEWNESTRHYGRKGKGVYNITTSDAKRVVSEAIKRFPAFTKDYFFARLRGVYSDALRKVLASPNYTSRMLTTSDVADIFADLEAGRPLAEVRMDTQYRNFFAKIDIALQERQRAAQLPTALYLITKDGISDSTDCLVLGRSLSGEDYLARFASVPEPMQSAYTMAKLLAKKKEDGVSSENTVSDMVGAKLDVDNYIALDYTVYGLFPDGYTASRIMELAGGAVYK
jgi:hypothetical protein